MVPKFFSVFLNNFTMIDSFIIFSSFLYYVYSVLLISQLFLPNFPNSQGKTVLLGSHFSHQFWLRQLLLSFQALPSNCSNISVSFSAFRHWMQPVPLVIIPQFTPNILIDKYLRYLILMFAGWVPQPSCATWMQSRDHGKDMETWGATQGTAL